MLLQLLSLGVIENQKLQNTITITLELFFSKKLVLIKN